MSWIQQKAIGAQIAMTAFVAGVIEGAREDERGQGSVEYVGIVLVVVAIIAAIIALSFTGIGQAIVTRLTDAVNSIGG